ncbi:MAG: hypothetical protein KDB00_06110 [Planctomycetales bacterium]|nr:hypothetical protein [Planctomycetales bacterium]
MAAIRIAGTTAGLLARDLHPMRLRSSSVDEQALRAFGHALVPGMGRLLLLRLLGTGSTTMEYGSTLL